MEESLPPGRYLQAFEICRRYNLSPQPVPEPDSARMEMFLLKWRDAWQKKYDALRDKQGDGKFNVNGDSTLRDLRDWEQYAEDNYYDELPRYGAVASVIAIALLPLMFK